MVWLHISALFSFSKIVNVIVMSRNSQQMAFERGPGGPSLCWGLTTGECIEHLNLEVEVEKKGKKRKGAPRLRGWLFYFCWSHDFRVMRGMGPAWDFPSPSVPSPPERKKERKREREKENGSMMAGCLAVLCSVHITSLKVCIYTPPTSKRTSKQLIKIRHWWKYVFYLVK